MIDLLRIASQITLSDVLGCACWAASCATRLFQFAADAIGLAAICALTLAVYSL